MGSMVWMLQWPLNTKIREAVRDTARVLQNRMFCSLASSFISLLLKKNHTTRMTAAMILVCSASMGTR